MAEDHPTPTDQRIAAALERIADSLDYLVDPEGDVGSIACVITWLKEISDVLEAVVYEDHNGKRRYLRIERKP